MATAATPSLASEPELIAFLNSRAGRPPGFPSAISATRLSGGNANFVWRVRLDAPLVDGKMTYVLKHSETFLAYDPNLKMSTDRAVVEQEARKLMQKDPWNRSLEPPIRVPRVYHTSVQPYLLFQEDAGDGVTLKSYFQTGRGVSPATAASIGTHLGEFIRRLHTIGTEHFDDIPKVFDHKLGRDVLMSVMYGSAGESVRRCGLPDALAERVDCVAREAGREVLYAEETLIMGDFWTGNILVQARPDESDEKNKIAALWIVDWEMTRRGVGVLDFAQFAVEAYLSARFSDPAASAMLDAYLRAYVSGGAPPMSETTRRQFVVHTACHIITWLPIMGWTEDRDTVKAEVERAAQALLDGREGRDDRASSSYAALFKADARDQ